MKSAFWILFYVRRNYVDKKGETGIMIRITLDCEISQFSSKVNVNPANWDTKRGKVIGATKEARSLKNTLENIRASIIRHYREIEIDCCHGIGMPGRERRTFVSI